jgi:enamine deaminase RidA (YjgF/YER057c/UK114 family)
MEAARWEPLEPMSSKSTLTVWGYRGKLKRFSELRLRVPGDPYPAWTNVGVTELFLPEAVVEIRCVAVIPKDAG